MSHVRLVVTLAVVLILGRGASGADPRVSGKVDDGLDAGSRDYPVFVRMADQLIGAAGEHERFCSEHAGDKRRELRAKVVQTLHDKADRSWEQVAKVVGELEKSGGVVDVERYWIVNGFACRASGEACRKLASLDAVSFVYLERGPLHQQKRAARPNGGEVSPQLRAIFQRVVDNWADDSDEPFTTKGFDVSWNLKAIQADAAWRDEKATGKGVVVALLDSGLMVAPALTKALWKNPGETFNGKDDDGNGYVDDLFGYDFQNDNYYCVGDSAENPHGSMCGGIIAGRPINKKNLITAVAPRARLMVLRGMGYLKAYEYALAQGADVLSMSYMWVDIELGNYRGVYRAAHEHLSAAGVVAVGGAGNFSRSPAGHQIALPKDIPCVIASAGLTREGVKAPASSEGPCTWNGVKFYDDFSPDRPLSKPDVTAVFTGFAVWNRPDDRNGKWTIYSNEGNQMALVVGPGGNSFSGPHAAGVAALMLSANPDLRAWDVKSRMEQTCKDIGPKGRDFTFGAGLLQARDAVRAARKPGR
jgi:subtilisin family serine protease